MKILILSLLIASTALCANAAKESSSAPAPIQLVEIRGELVPVYESLEGLGTPKTVKPDFPRDANGRRISGTALVGVLVDEKGSPLEVEVIESKPIPACGESAIVAAKKWRFPQVKREGKPTKYVVRVPMVFDYRS